ncbi:MAG: PstS family phosphate ABC transporter substrate-binding protein [Gaiellales bacterium]
MTIIAIGGIGAALAACGGGRSGDTTAASTAANADTSLSGSIVIDGSSTVAPLATLAAEKFHASAPNVNVTVGTSGTGGGLEKFCNGETDIASASRAIKDEEKAICDGKGITFKELLVANDGIALVANKENTWATCLTTDQLATIWGPDSKASSWKDVDPSFPDEPLKLYGPGTDSGTFDFFTKSINGEEGASRTDYSPSEDDNVTIKGVEGEKGGLGYFGLSYYEQNQDQLNLVQVDSGSGCVTPDATTVQDGTYAPLSRPLYLYIADTAAKRPEVKAFADFYVANEQTLTKDALFVPLSAEQATTMQAEAGKLAS